MSDDTDRKLPAPRPRGEPPSVLAQHPQRTGGVIETWVTGWRARQKAGVHDELAALNRAKTGELKAYGELAETYERTARIVRGLDDLPETLALDAAKAKVQRESDYAQLDDQSDERAHQRQLTELRRRRELQEAKRELVEENLDLLNSEQGYENQQRNKERNLRIWEKRREAQELDAHVETERVRTELRGGNAPPIPQSNMESMRAKAEEALMTALADGNDAEVERWQRVLDALGE